MGSVFESNDELRPKTSRAITDSLISLGRPSSACSTINRRKLLARPASVKAALVRIRLSCARTRAASIGLLSLCFIRRKCGRNARARITHVARYAGANLPSLRSAGRPDAHPHGAAPPTFDALYCEYLFRPRRADTLF